MTRTFPILATVLCVAATVFALTSPQAAEKNVPPPVATPNGGDSGLPADVATEIDQLMREHWQSRGQQVAEAADDATVLRRLSLSLFGTIPSLEELRIFDADEGDDKLGRWTRAMLADERFADYFADRLARVYVGSDDGQFLIFRRDRFTDWLVAQLKANRPYDALVRDLISHEGLWTGEPQTNFITATAVDSEIDENKLAARTVRAFLGQRIDCAQCHDHPFDDWTQADFEGLAAFYGQTQISVFGVEDKTSANGKPVEYVIDDPEKGTSRVVLPQVPFSENRLPDVGSRRARLAAWVTHPDNERFARATVSRLWALLFGRPFDPARDVDDLPDPEYAGDPDVLGILAADFVAHDFDLRRTIEVITRTRMFRMSSAHPAQTEEEWRLASESHAVFPMVRLRPEQVIGSVLQSASVKTIDRNSNFFLRFLGTIRRSDFVRDYGDLGDDEFSDRSGTVAQALLRMNGKLVKEATETNPLNASSRIARFARTNEEAIDLTYRMVLSRLPTPAEKGHFLEHAESLRRKAFVEDLYWTLINAEEFSWNH